MSKQFCHWHMLKFFRNIRNFSKVVYKVTAQNVDRDMKSGQKLEEATGGVL